ncbi:hypothetical protein [Sedimentitalea nanhaiensis]|uniref:hypothetical protein n=1 Tax=Sedimentitalea nanhaiensis TaxID=999627 RepID=UPI000411BB51|nr:hypothetical protein [Sedimentitalea nanhaiensis]
MNRDRRSRLRGIIEADFAAPKFAVMPGNAIASSRYAISASLGMVDPFAGPPRLLQLLMDIIHALRKRLAQTPPRIGALRQTPP